MHRHIIDPNFIQYLEDRDINNQMKIAINESIIIAITDEDGTITYANDEFCKVSKYSKEELIGQNHRILKSGFHSPEFYSSLWKTISNGETWKGEIKNTAKDGSEYWVKTVIIPNISKSGIKKFIAIRTEITSSKQLEEKMKEESLSSIFNKPRTPITPIIASLSALLDPQIMGKLSEQQYSTVETIQSNIKQLQKIIDDIFYQQKL